MIRMPAHKAVEAPAAQIAIEPNLPDEYEIYRRAMLKAAANRERVYLLSRDEYMEARVAA